MVRRGNVCSIALAAGLAVSTALPAAEPGEVTAAEAKKYGKELEFLIRGRRAAALEEFIREVAGLDDPKVVGYIPAAAAAFPSAANAKAAVEAIRGLANDASIAELAALLKKPSLDYRQALVILRGFAGRKDAATLTALLACLRSKNPYVQVAAILAARERKARATLPALLEILESHWKLRDRALIEARRALSALTGQEYDNPEDWKKYLATLPPDYDPAAPEEKKDSPPTAVFVRKTADSVEFFGGEIFSRSLVFVIDVSGSMLMYDDDPDYTGRDVESDRQRLRRAKDQLASALKKLPRGARFNVIAFSDKVLPWKKQLVAAEPENVASAIRFVGEFVARGATHTDEALELAFQDLGVDTIVLLSDGAPMKARERDHKVLIARILEKVRDLNACRRVRIDTFGFEGEGTWPSRTPGAARGPTPTPEEAKGFIEFLKTLASESGGTYRPIR